MAQSIHILQSERLKGVANRLNRNRLGDLLVSRGTISQEDLIHALRVQKQTGEALGVVLRHQGLISNATLRTTLAQQVAWRVLAAAAMFVIGFSTMGLSMSRATSATLEPTQQSQQINTRHATPIQPVALERNMQVARPNSYPSLFGTSETRSADISPFTKWVNVMARIQSSSYAVPVALTNLSGQSEAAKIEAVNSFYNKVRYVEDRNNYGVSDYWATPDEFVARGGDCEDYVIAKYVALKAMGFSENQLRLAVVQDTWKGIPHAVLVIYTSNGIKFLDNQYKSVKDADGFTRYRPIYSINASGWWRHS